ncbi:MAG: DUF1501 domain-containing protein [Planctomycetes bacterium]|nr:DUF1501 domain-containing protein [Planctomycetota bacterium]
MTHRFNRRQALAYGIGGMTTGLLGESLIGAVSADARRPAAQAGSVIYIFLSGGLSQLDSFDLKPNAPAEIRGDFHPIQTRTPGIQICEHLPQLAERSRHWSLVRSMSHPSNGHSEGHAMMLTGRTPIPPGFSGNSPTLADWPSIAAIAGQVTRRRGVLPAAAVLPERIVHNTGRTIPGQFAGQMGPAREPWFIEASPFRGRIYGAYPEYAFTMAPEAAHVRDTSEFRAPSLSLPSSVTSGQLTKRRGLLEAVERQRPIPAHAFDRNRALAHSLLSDPGVRWAFDVTNADTRTQDRYGRNSFGWSLLMARRLVEVGVNFVQVNLGNNEAWDLHGSIFPRLSDSLFPPTDRALSALLDDLEQTGLLDQTMIVMAGEFGRTPRLSTLPQHYRLPGRDHWGAVQTVWFAGGGVRGGQVIGSSDRQGGHPSSQRQTPENMAASIYHALGIPRTAMWYDQIDRPHHIYNADPIPGLI